jgi:hypothetical protein
MWSAEPMVQVIPPQGAQEPRVAEVPSKPEPIYINPVIEEVDMASYINDDGNLVFPGKVLVIREPGRWNLAGAQKNSKYYVPADNQPPQLAPPSKSYYDYIQSKENGQPTSHLDVIVGGTVSGSSPQDLTGFTIEIVDSKTQWRSGKIPIRADGVFMTNLHAEKGERHTYLIELCDPTGRKQKVTPDRLTYTIGAVVEEQPLPNSMGVALANNEYDKLFEKGRGLSTRRTPTTQPGKLATTASTIAVATAAPPGSPNTTTNPATAPLAMPPAQAAAIESLATAAVESAPALRRLEQTLDQMQQAQREQIQSLQSRLAAIQATRYGGRRRD